MQSYAGNEVTEVKKGKTVPFDGILMTTDHLAKLVTNLEKENEKLKIELASQKEKIKLKKELNVKITEALIQVEKSKYYALQQDLIRQKSIYENALNNCTGSVPWYSGPLQFIGGAVISGAICVGIKQF